MTSLQILAIMLSMLTPGGSTYSQTVVPRGSVTACPAPLTSFSPLCRAPRYNPLWGQGAWTRAETRGEALVRWHLIAKTIGEVSSNPPKGWRGSPDLMARTILSITRNESGWRRDVHSGIGKRARGDGGRSVCLGQIMKTRRFWKSPRGYRHGSLVGLSRAATRRCLETVADYLAHASKRVCGQAMRPACLFSAYGGGVKHSDPRIRARVATLLATYKEVAPLSEADRDTIGL
jgi:hypothetical protein